MENTPHTKTPIDCHAERCPVCAGHTTVNYGRKTCAACKGQGFIIVPNHLDEKKKEQEEKRHDPLNI